MLINFADLQLLEDWKEKEFTNLIGIISTYQIGRNELESNIITLLVMISKYNQLHEISEMEKQEWN